MKHIRFIILVLATLSCARPAEVSLDFGTLVVFYGFSIYWGAIMFWMAWGMFRSLPTLSVQSQASIGKSKNLFMSGAIMSLANPYWIIWLATIGIAYIVHAQKFGLWGVALFFAGHITGDLIWYWAVSVAVSKGKKLFTDKIYRTLIGICGAFLVGFAFYLVLSALGLWIIDN